MSNLICLIIGCVVGLDELPKDFSISVYCPLFLPAYSGVKKR